MADAVGQRNLRERRRARYVDRTVMVIMWAIAGLVTATFFWIVSDVVRHGFSTLSWEFLTTAPRDAGRSGGIAPIIVSTLLILAVCLVVAIPIGVSTALFLAEFTRGSSVFGTLVRRSLDVLAGVPSIVFGLFGNAFFCITLGMGYSILSGGLTLACMVLPILIRSTEEGFRAVPDSYRHGASALGLSRTTTVFQLLLPAAVPGLIVGLVLGIGRALAETAALLFTSGFVDRMPESLGDSGRAMSVHIYDLAMNVSGSNPQAYATAFVLIAILILTNGTASIVARRWIGNRILH
ncbi:MAG: phosphate ABC transporter permease PstA [Phycisphaerales bacterium]|nr:phosphate ABC transporter permease PstA [Phycisphaerales bacterium]